MESTVHPAKKRSAGKIIFWIFSPLLLVLALTVLLFGALSLFGFSYDDQAALLERAPMSARERYAFHAAQRTVDVAVDASDILFMLSQTGEVTPAALEARLKAYGVDLAAYGLSFEKYGIRFEDGASVTLLFRWLGFVPIPLRLDLDASVANGELNLRLAKVHITRLAALSAQTLGGKLGLGAEDLSYGIPLENLNAWLSEARGVSFSGGNMVLCCGIGEELFREVRADAYFAQNAVFYIDGIPELTIFLNAFSEKENKLVLGDDFTALLEELEAEPGKIESVRLDCLALAYPYHADKAFDGEKGEYLTRFLPNVTREAAAARHEELYSLYEQRVTLMSKLIQELNRLYHNGGVSYSDAELVSTASGEKLLLSQIVADYSPYEDFLSEADSRLMLCGGDIRAMAFGFETPLRDMPHDGGATFPGLDRDEAYMILLITRMKNDRPAYVYLAVQLAAVIVDPVSQEVYAAAMASEHVPSMVFGG